jgi:hypothetical protein
MQAGNEQFSAEKVEAGIRKAVAEARRSNPAPRPRRGHK